MKAQNSKLEVDKRKAIESFSDQYKNQKYLYQREFSYHGVRFLLHSMKEIPTEGEDRLESEVELKLNIYLQSPTAFSISLEDWCDEESQDCFLFEENRLAIQRDFAGKIVSPTDIIFIAEEKKCDGFYNFLRWILPRKMLELKKYILHSSCILDRGGKAHFFLGHSGAGKTTITSFADGRSVLGDDMNVIFEEGGELYASPGGIGGFFEPDVKIHEKFLVSSINWLVQDSKTERVRIDEGESVSKLMASFSSLFWESLPEESMKDLLDFSIVAASKVSFYNLFFQKNTLFWKFIEESNEFLVLNSKVDMKTVNNVVFILDSDNELMHELNETGSWLLRQLETPQTIVELTNNFIYEYEVEYNNAFKDINLLVNQLVEKDILLLKKNP